MLKMTAIRRIHFWIYVIANQSRRQMYMKLLFHSHKVDLTLWRGEKVFIRMINRITKLIMIENINIAIYYLQDFSCDHYVLST